MRAWYQSYPDVKDEKAFSVEIILPPCNPLIEVVATPLDSNVQEYLIGSPEQRIPFGFTHLPESCTDYETIMSVYPLTSAITLAQDA